MNDDRGVATPLLLLAVTALVLSLLIRGALAISTNPIERQAAYDVSAWLAGLLQSLFVGLLSAWAAVRILLRPRR